MGRKRHAAPEIEIEEPDVDDDEGTEDDPPVAAAPDVNAEAIKKLQADFDAERAERLRLEGRLNERERQPVAHPAAPVEETLDDAEIDEAIAAGGSRARALLEKAGRIEARKIAKVYEAQFNELNTKITGYGLPALARHEAHIASQGLDFYDDYKDEINQRLAQLPMETRTQQEAIQQIHALVVGSHLKEIVERKVEEALKKANGAPGAGPTNIRGRGQGDTRIPTADELWGPNEAAMVASKGGEDAYAKKCGFTDWGTMLRETGQLEVKGNA